MIEENVVAEAGTVYHLSLEEIRGAIADLGYEPRQRNVFYELIDSPVEAIVPKSRRNDSLLPIVN
jgi:cyclic dehypoxanthinyl futalosine synthase